MRKIIILSIFFSFTALTKEGPRVPKGQIEGVLITREFQRGVQLIFDCKRKALLCGNQKDRDRCDQELKKTKLHSKIPFLNCVPIASFPSVQECIKKQYERVHTINLDDFFKKICHNPAHH